MKRNRSVPIKRANWADDFRRSDFDDEETDSELESGTEEEACKDWVWTSVRNGIPRRSVFSRRSQSENVNDETRGSGIFPYWITVHDDGEQTIYECKVCHHKFEEKVLIYYHKLCEFYCKKPQQNGEAFQSSIISNLKTEPSTESESEETDNDTFPLCSEPRVLSTLKIEPDSESSESEDNVDDHHDASSLYSSGNYLFPLLRVSSIKIEPFLNLCEMSTLGQDERYDCQSHAPSSSNALVPVSLEVVKQNLQAVSNNTKSMGGMMFNSSKGGVWKRGGGDDTYGDRSDYDSNKSLVNNDFGNSGHWELSIKRDCWGNVVDTMENISQYSRGIRYPGAGRGRGKVLHGGPNERLSISDNQAAIDNRPRPSNYTAGRGTSAPRRPPLLPTPTGRPALLPTPTQRPALLPTPVYTIDYGDDSWANDWDGGEPPVNQLSRKRLDNDSTSGGSYTIDIPHDEEDWQHNPLKRKASAAVTSTLSEEVSHKKMKGSVGGNAAAAKSTTVDDDHDESDDSK